jgi:hypothetical protein
MSRWRPAIATAVLSGACFRATERYSLVSLPPKAAEVMKRVICEG